MSKYGDYKWFDVKIESVSVYAEDEEQAWDILKEIQDRFPKRVIADKPNFEMEVIDIKEAE